jgi:TorA maturation chaperone TorD
MAFLATQPPNESAHAAQQILLQRHVGAWVPLFLDALRASEPPRHYRMAAHYLQEIIAWDRRRWGISPLRHAVAA